MSAMTPARQVHLGSDGTFAEAAPWRARQPGGMQAGYRTARPGAETDATERWLVRLRDGRS
jgi:hypothetical protein